VAAVRVIAMNVVVPVILLCCAGAVVADNTTLSFSPR